MLEIFWFTFTPNKNHGHELMTWWLLLFFTGIEPTDVSQLDKYKLFSSILFQVAFLINFPPRSPFRYALKLFESIHLRTTVREQIMIRI